MGETWFTELSDELARCLVDARQCAETCEAALAAVGGEEDAHALVDVLAAPAAVARVLIDLIDIPPRLVLAAVHLCRELAANAAGEDCVPDEVAACLRKVADSATDLLEAAA